MEANKGTYPKKSEDGWVALVQHYFLSAWLPKPGVSREFFLKPLSSGLISAGVIVPVGTIEPGQSPMSAASCMWPSGTGPAEVPAPGLELTVDY